MNAAAVSRFLGKTYRRSITARTKIRGYSLTRAGFSVRQLSNAVEVEYISGRWTTGNEIDKTPAEMIASIRETLIKNGFVLNEASSGIVVIGKLEK
jgi:lambda repressor-like predicted transcriptional regulator